MIKTAFNTLIPGMAMFIGLGFAYALDDVPNARMQIPIIAKPQYNLPAQSDADLMRDKQAEATREAHAIANQMAAATAHNPMAGVVLEPAK